MPRPYNEVKEERRHNHEQHTYPPVERAGEAAGAQELLERAEAEGRDVGALEAALATYQASLAMATEAHEEAAAILAEHEGFDEDGGVTDCVAARHTVVRARQSLLEARRTLLKAVRDLCRAIRDRRQSARAPAALEPGS